MKNPDQKTIQQFLDKKVELWNLGKADELSALYDEIAPNGIEFEFVGSPVIKDGKKALDKMCREWGQHIAIELCQVLINGNEVACYVKNHRRATGDFEASIEIYIFDQGKLLERYFHSSKAADAFVEQMNAAD